MKENIPLNAKIVADFPIFIYIPEEFTNVRTFRSHEKDRVEQMRALVAEFQPDYIYYNNGPRDGEPLPTIGELLPGVNVKLLKVFSSEGKNYVRVEGDEFVIYQNVGETLVSP